VPRQSRGGGGCSHARGHAATDGHKCPWWQHGTCGGRQKGPARGRFPDVRGSRQEGPSPGAGCRPGPRQAPVKEQLTVSEGARRRVPVPAERGPGCTEAVSSQEGCQAGSGPGRRGVRRRAGPGAAGARGQRAENAQGTAESRAGGQAPDPGHPPKNKRRRPKSNRARTAPQQGRKAGAPARNAQTRKGAPRAPKQPRRHHVAKNSPRAPGPRGVPLPAQAVTSPPESVVAGQMRGGGCVVAVAGPGKEARVRRARCGAVSSKAATLLAIPPGRGPRTWGQPAAGAAQPAGKSRPPAAQRAGGPTRTYRRPERRGRAGPAVGPAIGD